MEQLKIEHFVRDHSGTPFPRFRPLPSAETSSLRTRLRDRLDVESHSDDLDLTRLVSAVSVTASGVSAEDRNFHLAERLLSWGIKPEPVVYINWYRYDIVDEMFLEDLSKYFQAIWYPAVDDIEVFDMSVSWVVVIAHTGDVGLARL